MRQLKIAMPAIRQIGGSTAVDNVHPRNAIGWLAVTLLAGCNGPAQPSGNVANETASTTGGVSEAVPLGNSVLNVAAARGTGRAGPPSADRQRQLAQAIAFIRRPEQQRDIDTAFRARASTHPAYCPAATFVPKRVDMADDPAPQFAADGAMTRGTVVYRATMQGCAIPLLLTTYVDAMPGMPLHFRVNVPGTSFADADLQERAIPQALGAARSLLGSCAQVRPIDTRLVGNRPDASGTLVPWSEYWLVAGCGRLVSTKLDFTPDPAANTMNVRADRSATRQLDPVAVRSAAPAAGPVAQLGPAGGAGKIVATATATSLIPLGGAGVPGAKAAGTCQFKLHEQAPATAPDGVECLSTLAAKVGATSLCTATRGAAKGQMIAAVTSIGQPSGSMTLSCTIRAQ